MSLAFMTPSVDGIPSGAARYAYTQGVSGVWVVPCTMEQAPILMNKGYKIATNKNGLPAASVYVVFPASDVLRP